MTTLRIAPLEAPFDAEVDAQLRAMMPEGVPPIALFRTFARNLPMARAMHGWGSYELSRTLSLTLRDREILIDRTTARCGCEYEWGVHIVFFAERAGLGDEQVRSLTHGGAADPCWTSARDQLLIRLADELHESCTVSDQLWQAANDEFSEAELLDVTMLCGWYHAISFTARAAAVPLEAGAPSFDAL